MAAIIEEAGRIYQLSNKDSEDLGEVTVFGDGECLLKTEASGWTLGKLSDLGEALQTLYASGEEE